MGAQQVGHGRVRGIDQMAFADVTALVAWAVVERSAVDLVRLVAFDGTITW